MERFVPICNNLESLVAELIASDVSDSVSLDATAEKLATLAEQFEDGSDGAGLGLQCVSVLRHLASNRLPHPSEALAFLTEAITTLSRWIVDPSATSLDAYRLQADEIIAGINVSDSVTTDSSAGVIPIPPADLDDAGGDMELLKDFAAEAADHLAGAESALLELESQPDNLEHINTVLRAFHTIKGASAFLGLGPVQDLAHRAESFLSQARDGEIQIADENADLALQSCDLLGKMIDSLVTPDADRIAPAGIDGLMLKLSSPMITGAKTATPDEVAQTNDTAELDTPTAPAEEIGTRPAATIDSTVRVSTSRLDDLIDMVGELVIDQSVVAQTPTGTTDVQTQTKNVAHATKDRSRTSGTGDEPSHGSPQAADRQDESGRTRPGSQVGQTHSADHPGRRNRNRPEHGRGTRRPDHPHDP